MNNIEIYDTEKSYFSNTHKNFNIFLNNIKKKELSNDNLKKIIILNKKLLEINNILTDINYTIDKKTNKINKTNKTKIEKEIINYEKNDKTISKFLPYIIYYRLLLDAK